MKNETGEFTYNEVAVWLQMLSKIGKCQGLADRAEEYAHRLVVDEEKNQGGCGYVNQRNSGAS